MRRGAIARLGAALIGLAALGPTMAAGQEGTAQADARDCAFAGPQLRTTRASIVLHGHALAYVAQTGLLAIRDDATGETQACMFFTAYSIPARPGDGPRPLTFVWNGGPGSNSLWLHLEAFGPKRIASSPTAADPPPPALRLEDNPATLLDRTDLVFVDPIGTGFSRPTQRAYEDQFFNTLGDAASVAAFVRGYLARFGRQAAPVFLIGESYGTWRAEAVAQALAERGAPARGLVLISGGLPIGEPEPKADFDALSLPNRTAAALFHHRLAPALEGDPAGTLRAAEDWAERVYRPALAHSDRLNDAERQAIVDGVARFAGIVPDARTLVVSRHDFLARLTGRPLDPLDMRLSAAEAPDPRRIALIGDYLRRQLGFDTPLSYQGLEPPGGGASPGSVNARWVYNQGAQAVAASDPAMAVADGPPGGVPPWLPRAFALDPTLRVFVATGLYDSYSSCPRMRATAARLDPRWQANISFGCYLAGHMIYRDAGPRAELARDVSAFIQRTLATGAGR